LRESAYQRRTRFVVPPAIVHDFTVRQADLLAARLCLPGGAPDWAHVPWKLWSRADEVADWVKLPDATRAWQICGNVPDGTPGHWLDTIEALVRTILVARGAVVEFVLHEPLDKPAHAHLQVACRELGRTTFGTYRPDWHSAIVDELRPRWLAWLGQDI
jgi:hypothetical protein